MKLRGKIVLVFGIALIVNLAAIYFGLTAVLDMVSSQLMKNQAASLALYLQHQAQAMASAKGDEDPKAWNNQQFQLAKHVSDESLDFDVSKILLIDQDFSVSSAWPESDVGASYAGDKDIQNAFRVHKRTVGKELMTVKGQTELDIDVVSWFELTPGAPRVLEVKLNFSRSLVLLEGQYRAIESSALILASLLLVGLLLTLLLLMNSTAIKPVLRVTAAIEQISRNNFETRLSEKGRDEFAALSRRFNEMSAGLQEKLKLYQYVSQGTIQAVQTSIKTGEAHAIQRKALTIMFTDIRSFTAFSENRDPADIVATLNAVLSIQAKIIADHNGDIDKFVGDEIMAVFPEPKAAIDAAIAIQRQLAGERPRIAGLHVGIGIHLGSVIQGDVGAERKKDYTVIGDAVNTAARLQSVAGADEIIVSLAVAQQVAPLKLYRFQPKGNLKLKGKENLVKSYSIDYGA
jgi:class 3 adenylate cyclase